MQTRISEDIPGGILDLKYLPVSKQVQVSTKIVVPIDEDFKEPSYYRLACYEIANSQPQDVIQFEINSHGGRADGMVALLTAMKKTEATTEAHVDGECSSAAAILALSCDSIMISPYSSMMIHYVSYGAGGKASDIEANVMHSKKRWENIFKETFKDFLTDKEIKECIDYGRDIWLTPEEIIQRLEKRQKKWEEQEKSE